LTLFLKVLEKQQEALLSAGFVAQKVGSRTGDPGGEKHGRRVIKAVAVTSGRCRAIASGSLMQPVVFT
jgi:hypothetical protein